jgi:hypothetical protein
MRDLGTWTSATVEHLRQHWQSHLVPAVAFFGATMGVSLVVGVLMAIATLVVTLAFAAIGSELLSVLSTLGLFVFAVVLVGVMVMAVMPLYVGHVWVVLRAHRGETPSSGDLLWGYRRLGTVVPFFAVFGVINLVAVSLCYLPCLLVSTAFMFAIPVMVDRELGGIEALRVSWGLAKPRFVELLVLNIIFLVVGMVLYYVPIIGPPLMFSVYVALSVVVYEALLERGVPGA